MTSTFSAGGSGARRAARRSGLGRPRAALPAWRGRNEIHRWDAATGAASVVRSATNRTRGLALGGDGRLFGAQSRARRVMWLSADGAAFYLEAMLDGERHNDPQDLVVDAESRVWFTDRHTDSTIPGPVGYPPMAHNSVLRLTEGGTQRHRDRRHRDQRHRDRRWMAARTDDLRHHRTRRHRPLPRRADAACDRRSRRPGRSGLAEVVPHRWGGASSDREPSFTRSLRASSSAVSAPMLPAASTSPCGLRPAPPPDGSTCSVPRAGWWSPTSSRRARRTAASVARDQRRLFVTTAEGVLLAAAVHHHTRT